MAVLEQEPSKTPDHYKSQRHDQVNGCKQKTAEKFCKVLKNGGVGAGLLQGQICPRQPH